MPSNCKENSLVESKDSAIQSDGQLQKPQMNAFQLLMESRNNVIGSNSEGKVIQSQQNCELENDKVKRKERKELFTKWSESKGSTIKRKREMEVEEYINNKMTDRVKKFKKILNCNKNHEDNKKRKKNIRNKSKKNCDNEDDPIEISENMESRLDQNSSDAKMVKQKHKRRKNLRKISSSSESEDFVNTVDNHNGDKLQIYQENKHETEKNSKLLLNGEVKANSLTPVLDLTENCTLSTNENQSKENMSFKENESSKSEENSQKTSSDKLYLNRVRQPEIIDDNAQDILITLPSTKSKEILQSNLLNFLGVIPKKTVTEIADIIPKNSKDLNIKMFPSKNIINRRVSSSSVKKCQSESSIEEERSRNDSDSSQEVSNRKRKGKRKIIRRLPTEEILGSSNSYSIESPQAIEHNLVDLEVIDHFRHTKSEESKSLNSIDLKVDCDRESNESENVKYTGRVLRPRKNNTKSHTPTSKHEDETSNVNTTIIESSDSDNEKVLKRKKSFKLAPIFQKNKAKSKQDKAIIEARQRFLVSGIPDSLKKVAEKQKSLELKLHNTYPEISHFQQKCTSTFWNLSHLPFSYIDDSCLAFDMLEHLKCSDLIEKQDSNQVCFTVHLEKINNMRSILERMKAECSAYPVYKVFRHLYEKNGKNSVQEIYESKKSSHKLLMKTKASQYRTETNSFKNVMKSHELWTEKYKPECSEEILGNSKSINKLKIWLETWMQFSEEINSRSRINENSNSESEFETSNSEDSEMSRLPGNTMILYGPCGTGKTSAVYAIAYELELNVLELNASSIRTGKKLVHHLQEATQSHQVEKNNIKEFINGTEINKMKKNSKTKNKTKKLLHKILSESEQKENKKMSVVLIEDIDLVFEQDEGFLASLSQFIAISKRPIILTTTDNSPAHVQKFINQYEVITFKPLALNSLEIWLEILCLVEGILVDRHDIGTLLTFNRGDMRKTLLEIQYWIQSGGQIQRETTYSVNITKSGDKIIDFSDYQMLDEELKIPLSKNNVQTNNFIHKQCANSFMVSHENGKQYLMPLHMNFQFLWFNIPSILNIPREKLKIEVKLAENELDSILNLYNALILNDNLLKSIKYEFSDSILLKDSLEINDRQYDISSNNLDIVQDIGSTLINGYIRVYRKEHNDSQYGLNLELPYSKNTRIIQNWNTYEKMFTDLIPPCNLLDHQSVSMDYFSSLRQIARSEENRAKLNTKRGSRFRHYFRDFKMNFNHSLCKDSCDTFLVNDNDKFN